MMTTLGDGSNNISDKINKLPGKKVSVSKVINIALAVALVLVVAFGWWYMKGSSPVDVVQSVLPGVPQPKYLYTIYGSGTSRLRNPYHTYSTGDRIYVADTYNSRVVVFDYNGKFLFSFGGRTKKPGAMLGPTWITEINNEIYVVDCDLGGVEVWSRDGKFLRVLGNLKFPRPFAIAYLNNKYYVTDIGTHKIYVIDNNGKVINSWGKQGNGDGEFYYTYGITARDNKLYVADANNNRIQVFDEKGKLLQVIRGQDANGAGGFSIPRGVAFDSRGYLFTAEMMGNAVAIINPGGVREAAFTYAEPERDNVTDQLTVPTSVFIDRNNRLFVTELGKSRVLVYQL